MQKMSGYVYNFTAADIVTGIQGSGHICITYEVSFTNICRMYYISTITFKENVSRDVFTPADIMDIPMTKQ